MYHSRSESKDVKELVKDHLAAVGKLAGEFAAVWEGGAEAEAAGRMHDIGKYGDLFQRVLKGQASHVDHWTAGAYLAALRYGKQGAAIALAIQGHHAGLQQGCLKSLQQSLLLANTPQPGNGRQWAGNPTDILEQRWRTDASPELPESLSSPYVAHAAHEAAAMLDVRMLFSTLVDADWLSAEAHENRDEHGPVYRPRGPALQAPDDLTELAAHVERLREKTQAAAALRTVRDRLMRLCLEGGTESRGLYTLAAPTGAGKTLSMLAWALRQCETHGLRRIIAVLPYLSILDQTLDAFRRVFPDREPGYIIEDDSLARDIGEEHGTSHLLAENWDAPVIVTTTVRFFESLFSDRPADCRKLHRIAGSVVLFDEAQTLPLPLAVPTLAAVASLVTNYRCSALFSTATQPAFDSFSDVVNQLAGTGWNPKTLVPAGAGLFDLPRRVRVNYQRCPVPLKQIAEQMSARPAALAVVNLKRHARALYGELINLGCEDALHVSTAMCPAHRREALEEVRKRLATGQACRLAATQCLEAGVDLSFPALWRALAPLDSLCQAAGRCNREGRLSMGEMTVFVPEPDGKRDYPDDAYENAAKLVNEMDDLGGFPDLFDPDVIRDYYTHLYARSRGMRDENGKKSAALETAIAEKNFPEVARLYQWIGRRGINILVPYGGRMNLYEELAALAGRGAVNAAWFRRAREITVGAFVGRDSPALGWLAQVKKGKEAVENWYVLLKEDLYEEATGLSLEKTENDSHFIADGR